MGLKRGQHEATISNEQLNETKRKKDESTLPLSTCCTSTSNNSNPSTTTTTTTTNSSHSTDVDDVCSVGSATNHIVPPCSSSKRTLVIEYWPRSEACKEAKWTHLEQLIAQEEEDSTNTNSREEHILSTTLKGSTTVLEPNMFPYDTPPDIEHWTLWSREELSMEAVSDFVEQWIRMESPTRIIAWNYDENESRSIDIFHVHVYFQIRKS